jgi:hypothetical protein
MSREARKFISFITIEALLAAIFYAVSGLPVIRSNAAAVLMVYCIAFAFVAGAVAGGVKDAAWILVFWLGPILAILGVSWFFIVGL